MRHRLIALSAVIMSAGIVAPAVARAPVNFADLVEDVMPAVVNISTSQTLPGSGLAITTNSEAKSLGSGFIINSQGYVVTNGHVIEDADIITVTLENGEEYQATLKGVDRETDLAVLKIDTKDRLPFVKFGDSDGARVGEWVVAIGQPFGLGGSVSVGIISARNRDIDSGLYDDFIQTDAAINRGNSGGPLFDTEGRVIGVNTVIYSQTGGSVGVGFAVPATLANRVTSQLIEHGETYRGYLGVLLDDITEEHMASLDLKSKGGALVIGIPSLGGPAGMAGIQEDDVIVRFNGRKIEERRDLNRAVAEASVGATVPVVLIRDGEQVTLRVRIARRETATALRSDTIETQGLTLEASTAETKALFGLPDDIEGVVITNVDSHSPVAEKLRPGDVILEIGWNEVRDPASLESQLINLRDAQSGPVQILVRRGDRLFYAHITP